MKQDKRFCTKCGFAIVAAPGPEDTGVCRCPMSTRDWEEELKMIIDKNKLHTSSGSYHVKNELKSFITKLLAQEKEKLVEEILKDIDPFDLVEGCNPDCTPEEHAYHEGTWKAQLKLEKILDSVKQKYTSPEGEKEVK